MKRILLLLLALLPLLVFAQRADTPKYVMHGAADSLQAPPKSPLEVLWEQQTAGGNNLVVDKATAGFYSTGRTAGIYAFHNTIPRGTVLKVRNVNNDRITYVKVLGPLPQTKQFAGCVLGLTNEARVALDVHNTRALCEISYMAQ